MEMQRQADMVQLPDGSGRPVEMRIGIHSGPLMSGIIGSIRKRYCVVGSTVNLASRCVAMAKKYVLSSYPSLFAQDGEHGLT